MWENFHCVSNTILFKGNRIILSVIVNPFEAGRPGLFTSVGRRRVRSVYLVGSQSARASPDVSSLRRRRSCVGAGRSECPSVHAARLSSPRPILSLVPTGTIKMSSRYINNCQAVISGQDRSWTCVPVVIKLGVVTV